jgi:alpha-L-fucosidase
MVLHTVLPMSCLLMAGCAPRQPTATAAVADTGSAARSATSERAARVARWQRLGHGMFVHWGLYSELGGVWHGQPVKQGYSEQIQSWANIPRDEYAKVAERFTAVNFDADAICRLAKDAGARYIVVTSKHHDGFAMFDTASTDFDIVDRTPFGKDPLKLLSAACRRQGLGFGVYFSLVDWHAGHAFDPDNGNPIPASMEPLIERQLRELMTNYGPITEVWFDMSAPTAAQSRRFAAIVRELQPQAAINGRIWNNVGDFVTLGDNESPAATMQPPFQTPASIYHATWGYRSWQVRDDRDGKIRELVRGLVDVRAAGGNYLLNIGPKGDGSVVPFEAEVLHGIGAWLRRHPDAMPDARPSGLPPPSWGATTRSGDTLFLYVHEWRDAIVLDGVASDPRRIVLDGAAADSPPLGWRRNGNALHITLPARAQADPVLPVLRVEFDAPPRIVPPWTVAADANGHLRIARALWRAGTSFGFGSGYRSQYPTTVQLSVSVTSPHAQQVMLRLRDVKAGDANRYRIAIGDSVIEADGAQLRSAALGPFALPATDALPLTIRLAAPDWPAEDLGLDFGRAELQPLRDGAPR